MLKKIKQHMKTIRGPLAFDKSGELRTIEWQRKLQLWKDTPQSQPPCTYPRQAACRPLSSSFLERGHLRGWTVTGCVKSAICCELLGCECSRSHYLLSISLWAR